MSNNKSVGMTCDDSELQMLLSFFSGDQWDGLKVKALNTAAKQYKESAKNYFVSALPSANRASQSGYKDRLIDAVRQSQAEVHGDEVTTKVHIMGVRSSGSGTFRARFFERGTKERMTKSEIKDSKGRTYKKGKKLGRIKSLNFFAQSQNSLGNVTASLDEILTNLINKNVPK